MRALRDGLFAVLLAVMLRQASSAKEPTTMDIRKKPEKWSSQKLTQFINDPNNAPKVDYPPNGTHPQPDIAGTRVSPVLSSQIIGGTTAASKQFPWQVYIISDGAWLCGGSIISEIFILTAAHCVYKRVTFVVTAGGVTRNTVETGEIVMTSTVKIVHENYNPVRIWNDIALIRVPHNYTFNDFIKPIRLPKTSDANKTFSGILATASGFGKTSNLGATSQTLMFVNLKVISNSECSRSYGSGIISSIVCTAAYVAKSICSASHSNIHTLSNTLFDQQSDNNKQQNIS
ncbi:Hypothetical predicted protein [Cloeon dipterum]|uniref:Peptidase S1 domain-containing protein n=1 Tax=Cloeon dipterum TaxID=197152 RepID=A0A8S1D2Z0_9INSE|nr:Hypothetical predicted protein [Cloeon dipterum]